MSGEAVATAGEKTLASRFVRSFSWAAVARGSQQVVALLATAVLARLLSPAAFGVMGMATMFMNFASATTEFVISDIVLQKQEIEGDKLSSLFWFNMLIGIAMTLGLMAAAPWAAAFFHEPQVREILRALAALFVISAAANIQRALFYREMDLRGLALAQCAANVAGLALAVALAWRGAGVWSLVASALITKAIDSALMWVLHPWRPGWRMRWSDLRPVAGFGLNISGFGLVNYFSRNADNVIVGRALGSTSLGYYQNAYALMFYPQQLVTVLISSVSIAPLSKLQHDDERFRASLLRLSAFTVLLLAPAMLGLLATSDLVVAILLGPQWGPSAAVVAILTVAGCIQTLTASTLQLFIAKGRADMLFRWSLITAAASVLAFLCGLPWGIRGVAAAYAVVTAALTIPQLRSALGLIGMPLGVYLRALEPLLRIAVVMAGAVAAWRWMLGRAGVEGVLPVFASSVAIGAIVYGGLAFRSWPAILHDIVEQLAATDVGPVRSLAAQVLRLRKPASKALV